MYDRLMFEEETDHAALHLLIWSETWGNISLLCVVSPRALGQTDYL